jgi:hypothetical protein
MAQQTSSTDMGLGLAFVLGAIAVLGALVSTGAAYRYALDEQGTLLVLSGLGIGVAMLAGGLAVTAMHVFDT